MRRSTVRISTSIRGASFLTGIALLACQLGACSSSNLMAEDGGAAGTGAPNSAGAVHSAGSTGMVETPPGDAGMGGESPADTAGAAHTAGASGLGGTGGQTMGGMTAGGATSAGTSGGGASGAGISGGGSAGAGTAGAGTAGAGGSLVGSAGSASGGTAGMASGGAGGVAGGAASCGNGMSDVGEVCDQPFSVNDCGADCKPITGAICATCDTADGTCKDFANCDSVAGSAPAGGPAAGVPRKALCNEVLDCVRDSACAKDQAPIKCYCGTASASDCQAGHGNGKCKSQIERGLETTSFATITQRIGDSTYGGGVAMQRIDCDQTFCADQCF